MRDLIGLLDDLKARGVAFHSLTEAIDTTTPTGRATWQMVRILAELERSLIQERTKLRPTVKQLSHMTSTRVNEIDLLRFFAALAVVFFHYSFRGYAADAMSVMPYPLLASVSKYGYLGVQLFFMISGFVILMTAANGSLRSFAFSRIVRLYPAFWACCTITFLVTLSIGEPRYYASIGQYIGNMTMLSNFFGIESIDGAYWSLFVEIRFYVLIAIVLVIGRMHQAQIFILVWLISSVALEIHPVGKLRALLITNFSAFFIAGAVYFLIWSKGPSLIRIAIITVSWWLALFQSINGLENFEKHYNTSMNSYIVAVIITIFFAVMMLVSLRRTGFIGRNRWMLVGSLTYPLYLLHQNIGFMIFNIAYPEINMHILFWGTIVVALVSAYSVHYFIERRLSSPMKATLNTLADYLQRLTMGTSKNRT